MAVAHGLGNAQRVIAAIQSGAKQYHFIEVMTCPGGCIGGGGQPRFTDNRVRQARIAAIYQRGRRQEAPQVAREPGRRRSSTPSFSASRWARSRTTCCTPSTRPAHLQASASRTSNAPLSRRERVRVRAGCGDAGFRWDLWGS